MARGSDQCACPVVEHEQHDGNGTGHIQLGAAEALVPARPLLDRIAFGRMHRCPVATGLPRLSRARRRQIGSQPPTATPSTSTPTSTPFWHFRSAAIRYATIAIELGRAIACTQATAVIAVTRMTNGSHGYDGPTAQYVMSTRSIGTRCPWEMVQAAVCAPCGFRLFH